MRALALPAREIARMSARIGHDVDGRGAAEDLAALELDTPAVEMGLGLGSVAPVVQAIFMHLSHSERNVDQWIDVAAAGFEQKNACGLILAQSVGENATGRARADYDVIEDVVRHAMRSRRLRTIIALGRAAQQETTFRRRKIGSRVIRR